MVNCFKNHFVKLVSSWIFEWELHHLKGISEALNTNTYGSVFEVRALRFSNWVVIIVYNLI